jgi:hypothetical protein
MAALATAGAIRSMRRGSKGVGDTVRRGINFVGGIGNGDAKYFGPAMPLIPKTSNEDLAENIEATKAFIRGCFERQPTSEEFETILAFNMVVPAKIRGWLRRPAPYEEHSRR